MLEFVCQLEVSFRWDFSATFGLFDRTMQHVTNTMLAPQAVKNNNRKQEKVISFTNSSSSSSALKILVPYIWKVKNGLALPSGQK